MWVVKMTNGRGHVEWYATLAVRAQARRKEHAQQFASREEAEETARMCMQQSMRSAFSSKYWNESQSVWTLVATVEPV
ncbi:MAG: hypothetical protein K2W82_17035 [Candidatus Obscuribacterales bacterium]|nr:hypothetical protein [Candidatus Obscuribacterales bacterium]